MSTKTMDCAEITEVLPWFLNGTLENGVKDRIRSHLEACEACRRQLDETAFAARVYDQHVPTEALVDYAFDRPPGDLDRGTVERHLASCAACREELDLVRGSRRALEEPARPVAPLAEVRHEDSDEGSSRRFRPRDERRLGPRRVAGGIPVPTWLAAAAGVVLVAGLSVWTTVTLLRSGGDPTATESTIARLNTELGQARQETERLRTTASALRNDQDRAREEAARLKSRLVELERPAANVVAVDILPSDLVERSATQKVNEVVLAREATSITLILQAHSDVRFPGYAIELVDAAGNAIWSARGLVRNPTGDYTVHVPASFVALGTYRINVYGERNGSRTRTESYTIRVTRSIQQ